MKILRILLIVFPIVSLVSLVAGMSMQVNTEPGPAAVNVPVPVTMMSLFSISYLICIIIVGIYAKKTNRSVGGWVAGSIFVPYLPPLILAFLKPAPVKSYYTGRPSAEAPAGFFENSNASFKNGNMSEEDNIALAQGFCSKCIAETTDESPGNVNTVNGIGTALMGTRWLTRGLDRCPQCGSVIQTKWTTFGFGISKHGTYRILYTKQGFTKSKFFGRRLKSDYAQVR